MNKHQKFALLAGTLLGMVYGIFQYLLTKIYGLTLTTTAHVLLLSLGVVLGISLLIFSGTKNLKISYAIQSGIVSYFVFTLLNINDPFLSIKTWVIENGVEKVIYSGIKWWLEGVTLGLMGLVFVLILFLVILRKARAIQESGFIGGFISGVILGIAKLNGVPPEYQIFIVVILFILLPAISGTILALREGTLSAKRFASCGFWGWIVMTYLSTTLSWIFSPRFWHFPDNWHGLYLLDSVIFLPSWLIIPLMVMFISKKLKS